MSHAIGLTLRKIGDKIVTAVTSLATDRESEHRSFDTAEDALADIEGRELQFRKENDGLGYETVHVSGFYQERQAVNRVATQRTAVEKTAVQRTAVQRTAVQRTASQRSFPHLAE